MKSGQAMESAWIWKFKIIWNKVIKLEARARTVGRNLKIKGELAELENVDCVEDALRIKEEECFFKQFGSSYYS